MSEPSDCNRCDAVCCRLTVVLQAGDDVPARFTDVTEAGLSVMARDEEGWRIERYDRRYTPSLHDGNRPDNAYDILIPLL